MSSSALGVNEVYSLVTHTDGPGIEGYHVEKKYFDAAKQVQERELLKVKKGQKDRRHVTKRGNFLDDETKMRKIVPGPGQYPITSEWPEESKLKINYPNKQTYVDEIMKSEKKEKKPAPGQYNVTKTMKDMEAEKKALAAKKIHYEDRITYLDGVQHSSNLLPGVGNYNPRVRSFLLRTASKQRLRISRPNLKTGARSTSNRRRRNLPKVQTCGPTRPCLPTSWSSTT